MEGRFQLLNTYSGTIRFSPLEGGFWKLESQDGNTYQLVGALKSLKDGQRVIVEGEIEKRRVSFVMAGPILKVKNIVLQE